MRHDSARPALSCITGPLHGREQDRPPLPLPPDPIGHAAARRFRPAPVGPTEVPPAQVPGLTGLLGLAVGSGLRRLAQAER